MTARRPTRQNLLDEFETYGVPRERWLVGAEFERHLLDGSGMPLPYAGQPGIRSTLEDLSAHGTWKPYLEEGALIALERPGASVTLEPGGQFELSGSPFATLDGIEQEARAFHQEVAAVLDGTDVRQVALGHTPYARIPDIDWMPKGRYVIMREALAARGDLAHNMMKGTCAVQASFDFSDEEDCARKVRASVQLGPLTTAMFANSPIVNGEETPFASFRGHVWTRTDPDRTGFPAAAVDFSYAAWLDYLLDVPLLFRKHEGRWFAGGGHTFRSWLEHGIDGTYPRREDWDLHLTSVFPEVRVKKKIEIRGADCVSMDLAMAFTALFKGLFYCDTALDEALEISEEFSRVSTRDHRFAIACEAGLSGQLEGTRMAAWSERVVSAAAGGLDRCFPADRHYLTALEKLVERASSPADAVRRAFREDPRPGAFLDRFLL